MNKKYFLCLIVFLLVGSVYAGQIVLFNFESNNGDIILKDVKVREGFASDIKDGDYSFYLLNKNEVVEKFNFKMVDVIEIVPFEEKEGKHLIRDNFNFTVVSDYKGRIDKIRIEKDNEILFEEDVSKYELGRDYNYLYLIIFIFLIIIIYLIYRIKKK